MYGQKEQAQGDNSEAGLANRPHDVNDTSFDIPIRRPLAILAISIVYITTCPCNGSASHKLRDDCKREFAVFRTGRSYGR